MIMAWIQTDENRFGQIHKAFDPCVKKWAVWVTWPEGRRSKEYTFNQESDADLRVADIIQKYKNTPGVFVK